MLLVSGSIAAGKTVRAPENFGKLLDLHIAVADQNFETVEVP